VHSGYDTRWQAAPISGEAAPALSGATASPMHVTVPNGAWSVAHVSDTDPYASAMHPSNAPPGHYPTSMFQHAPWPHGSQHGVPVSATTADVTGPYQLRFQSFQELINHGARLVLVSNY
jgi:hypothetical protein